MGCICATPSPGGPPPSPVRLVPSPIRRSPPPSYKASNLEPDHSVPEEHLASKSGAGATKNCFAQPSGGHSSADTLPKSPRYITKATQTSEHSSSGDYSSANPPPISPKYNAKATQTSGAYSSGYYSLGYSYPISSQYDNRFNFPLPDPYNRPSSMYKVADRDRGRTPDFHGYETSQDRARRRSRSRSSSPTSRRVPCEWPGCNATFSVVADAKVYKHVNCTHHIFEKYIDCPIESCDRKGENGFANKDHLLKHKREFHCMDLPKRDQIQYGKHSRRASAFDASKYIDCPINSCGCKGEHGFEREDDLRNHKRWVHYIF